MSLYGRTDSNANKTKAGVGIGASSQAKTVLYIDETEAALEANKERGLNAPGWWSYFTYTDSSGATRHKAEQLVFVAGGDTNSNETQADDATAADVAVTIAITQQPTQIQKSLLLMAVCSPFQWVLLQRLVVLLFVPSSGRRSLVDVGSTLLQVQQQQIHFISTLALLKMLVNTELKLTQPMVVKK